MTNWNDVKTAARDPYSRDTRKLCPMISDKDQPAECVTTACAWWDNKWGRCSVFSIACKK